MKRKLLTILCACLSLSVIFAVYSCGNNSSDFADDTGEYKYEWTYVEEFIDECDADMKIDGVMDEERWQDKHYLYHSEEGVDLSYTTIFTEKGLYIGAKAVDPEMKWNARFNFSHWGDKKSLNSAFWFQICGPDVADGHGMRLFNFFVDAFNKASRNQTRFNAASKLNGDILKGEATEMTVEFFASWDALNIELGENGELPDFVYIVPTYRYVLENNSSCADNRWINPTCTYPRNTMWWNLDGGYAATVGDFNWYRVKTGVKFNEEGYMNYDREGSPVGRSANGLSMSAGWDLSKAAETGEVSSVAPYEQYAFIKGVYAEKYYFKTTLVIDEYKDGNPGNEWPSIGLATVQSNINLRALYIEGVSVLNQDTKNGCYYTPVTSIDLYTWQKSPFGTILCERGKDIPTEGYTLELIKDGASIYYIVEGQFAGSDYALSLAGKACPALFSIGGRGTFKNTEVSTDSDVVDEMIRKYARKVVINVEGSGSVTSDRGALRIVDGATTQDLTLSIVSDADYAISDLTIGGVNLGTSDWEYFVENYADGKLIIPKEMIEDDVTVNVTFQRLRSSLAASDVVELSGTIAGEQGEKLVGSELIIFSESCKTLYYPVITSATGKYSISLPKAGNYGFGTHGLVCDGEYKVLVVGSGGYKSVTETVNMSDAQNGKLSHDIVLQPLEFRPTVKMSDRYRSSLEYRTGGVCALMGAYYFEDKSVEQDEEFVVYTTLYPNNGISSEVGFIVGTGDNRDGNYLFFALKRTSGLFSAYVWTEGGSKVGYNDTPVTFFGEKRWMHEVPYGENKDLPLDVCLIYKDGKFTLKLNGCTAFELSETSKMAEGWPAKTYKAIIGTNGAKKIGLISLNTAMLFYDWGFSTDAAVIDSYVNATPKPVPLPEIVVDPTPYAVNPKMAEQPRTTGNPSVSYADDQLQMKGVYFFDTKGVRVGTDFVATAEIVAEDSVAELGFIIGTGTALTDGNYMQFVWQPKEHRMYVWNQGEAAASGGMALAGDAFEFEGGLAWMTTEPFGDNGQNSLNMALVYSEGTYSLYFNEQLACSWAETATLSGSDSTIKQYVEGGYGLVRLGLVSTNGITTFANWGYTTDADVIAQYGAQGNGGQLNEQAFTPFVKD